MSAEAWRRIGSDLEPLALAWQAWYLQHLRPDLRGRRDTFSASGSICVAGVVLWRRIVSDLAPLDLAWQACYFQRLRLDLCGRCGTFGTFIDVRGSLATNWVGFGAAGSCVAGVLLSAPQARFAWQAWHFQDLIDVRGSSATNWVGWTPLLLTWQA